MLCLGPKKSLMSPRLKLTAQGAAYQCSKVECEDHLAIQVPQTFVMVKTHNLQSFGSVRYTFVKVQTHNPKGSGSGRVVVSNTMRSGYNYSYWSFQFK